MGDRLFTFGALAHNQLSPSVGPRNHSPLYGAATHGEQYLPIYTGKGGAVTARTYNERPSKFENSSALETAPDSRRGILTQWQRQRAKFYCTYCQTMQAPKSVGGITQAPEHASYDCTLQCGHSRQVTINVQRTAAIKKQMAEDQEVKQAEKEQAERDELLSDMADARLL